MGAGLYTPNEWRTIGAYAQDFQEPIFMLSAWPQLSLIMDNTNGNYSQDVMNCRGAMAWCERNVDDVQILESRKT